MKRFYKLIPLVFLVVAYAQAYAGPMTLAHAEGEHGGGHHGHAEMHGHEMQEHHHGELNRGRESQELNSQLHRGAVIEGNQGSGGTVIYESNQNPSQPSPNDTTTY